MQIHCGFGKDTECVKRQFMRSSCQWDSYLDLYLQQESKSEARTKYWNGVKSHRLAECVHTRLLYFIVAETDLTVRLRYFPYSGLHVSISSVASTEAQPYTSIPLKLQGPSCESIQRIESTCESLIFDFPRSYPVGTRATQRECHH